MGTTPRGLRYPEPTELLTNAHAHIKALAQDADAGDAALGVEIGGLLNYINTHVTASYCHCNQGSAADLGVSDGASALVDFGVLGATAGWSQTNPSTFTYNGPNRLVLVTSALRISPAAGPDNNLNAKVALLVGGVVDVEHHESLNVPAVEANLIFAKTVALSNVIGVTDGSTVQMRVTNNNAYGETLKVQAAGRSLKMTGLGLY